MTGAKLREAVDLLRSLKQKYPEDSDELLQQQFRKELERHPAMRRAVIEDIYRGWLREYARRTKKFKARVFHLVTLRLPVLSRIAGDAPVSHSPPRCANELNLTFACGARPCCVSSARSPPQPPERRVRALPQLERPAYRAVCASSAPAIP